MAFCQIHGLVITNKWPNVSVPLENFAVYASFINNNVDVSCEFSYNNTSSELIETEFIFPLEATAAVYFLEAVIGSKRLTAICRERIEAETAYTEAVESGHTAFMMQEDYRMGDTFKMKMGNIPPKESIKLTFKYVIPLCLRKADLALDRFVGLKDPFVSVFSMPARIGERYDPNPGIHGDRSANSQLAAKMSFTADIYADGRILSVTSAHHKFLVDFEDKEKKRAKVSLDGDMDLSHDFELELAVEDPYTLWAPCELGQADKGGFLGMHCVTANFLPDIPQSKAPDGDKLEIIFVLDRSGSMSGTRISKTKESLLLFLKSLPRKCRFQIVGFGSMFSALFNEPVDYTKENLNRALEYQSNLKADMGGTEVFQALKSVYDTPITGAGWYRQIIFLTDGEIYNQDEVIGLVARNQSNARLFAIGLGDEVSTSLIWGVARAGRGTASFIRNDDNLRSTTMSVLKAALQPMLTDVELKWDVRSGGKALDILTVPSQLPPLFSENYMAAFGLIPAPPSGGSNASDIQGTLTLNYKLAGQIHSMVAKIQSLPVEHSSLGLHRLAAKAQIFELVDKHSALGEDDGGRAELRQQIVAISTNTNVISPFTSFIGVDPDKQENFEKPIRNIIFPHGVVEADAGPANFAAFSKMAAPCAAPLGSQCRGFAQAGAPASGGLFGAPAMLCSTGSAAPASSVLFGATTFHKCAVEGEEVTQATDTVVRLAELQDFDGFWNMDRKLSELLNLTTGQMTSARPSQVKDDQMWATALVIAYLQVRMSDRREEWEMMVQKAMDWLRTKHNWTDASPLLGDAEKALAKLLPSQ